MNLELAGNLMAKQSDSKELVTVKNSQTQLELMADKPLSKILRSAIAAIPLVGGSISVLVESELTSRQGKRIEILYARLAELEAQHLTASYSENLLEYASARVQHAPDPLHSRIAANLLVFESEHDATEVVRTHLVDIATSLSLFQLALLMQLSNRDNQDLAATKKLLELDTTSDHLAPVRAYSIRRLCELSIATKKGEKIVLASMGNKIASAIK
jgi:hypothetical protein